VKKNENKLMIYSKFLQLNDDIFLVE